MQHQKAGLIFLLAAFCGAAIAAPVAPVVTYQIVGGDAQLEWQPLQTEADGVCGYEIIRYRPNEAPVIDTVRGAAKTDTDYKAGDGYVVAAIECPAYMRRYASELVVPEVECPLTPVDGSVIDGTTATFTAPVHQDATLYDLYIGTGTTGGTVNDIEDLQSSATPSFTATNLPNDGSTIHVTLDVFSGETGSLQQLHSYPCTYTSGTAAAPATCPLTPAAGTTLTGTTQTFSWAAVPNADLYDIFAGTGTTAGTIANIANGDSSASTGIQLTGLPSDGSDFFVTRDSFSDNGDGTYDPIGRETCAYTAWTDPTPPPPTDPTTLADNFQCVDTFTPITKAWTWNGSTADFHAGNLGSGQRFYYYNHPNSQIPDQTVYDQRGVEGYPVTFPQLTHRWRNIRASGAERDWCYSGGAHIGRNPLSMMWGNVEGTKERKNNFLESNNYDLTIEGVRVHNIHDFLSVNATDTNIEVRDSWISYNRDDIYEGYLSNNITFDDVLVEGTYAFLSDPDGSCNSAKSADPGDTFTIRDSIIRLQSLPGPFGTGPDEHHYNPEGGHGQLWKEDSCYDKTADWPDFVLENNVFLIEGPVSSRYSINNTSLSSACILGLPGECKSGTAAPNQLAQIQSCSNNLFIYLEYDKWASAGHDEFIGEKPKPGSPFYNASNPNYLPNGSDCFQMVTDDPSSPNYDPQAIDIYYDRREQWIAEHTGHSDPNDQVMQIAGVDQAIHAGKTVTLQNVGSGRCIQSDGSGGISMQSCDSGSDQQFDVEWLPRSGKIRGALLLRDYAGRYLRTPNNSSALAARNDSAMIKSVITTSASPASFSERWYIESHANEPTGANANHYSIQTDALRLSYIRDDGSDLSAQGFYENGTSTPLPQAEFHGPTNSLRWVITEVGNVIEPVNQVSWVGPADGSTLTTATPLFDWQNDDGNTARQFDLKIATTAFPAGVYSTANVIYDSVSLGSRTNTTSQPPTLPTDGNTLYGRLSWSQDNGVWPSNPQDGITAGRYIDLSWTAHTAASNLTDWSPGAAGLQAFGELTSGELASIYGLSMIFDDNTDNFAMVDDGGSTVMRVRFVPSSQGSERAQHAATIPGSPTAYQVEFDALFESPFDPGGTNIGGKFGIGLGGGSYPNGCIGAVENGFSASWMWRQHNGAVRAEIYTYSADMVTGDDCGTDRMTTYAIPDGEWVRFKMEVGLNTQGQANGYLKAWINGVLYLDDTGIEWWGNTNTPQIDRLVNKNFHGGNDSTWSPSGTQYGRFRNVRFGAP